MRAHPVSFCSLASHFGDITSLSVFASASWRVGVEYLRPSTDMTESIKHLLETKRLWKGPSQN